MHWILRCVSLAQIRDERHDTRLPQFPLPLAGFKVTMQQMPVLPMPLSPSHMVQFLTIPINPPLTSCSLTSFSQKSQGTCSIKRFPRILTDGRKGRTKNLSGQIYIGESPADRPHLSPQYKTGGEVKALTRNLRDYDPDAAVPPYR